jgi:hypothetical protein
MDAHEGGEQGGSAAETSDSLGHGPPFRRMKEHERASALRKARAASICSKSERFSSRGATRDAAGWRQGRGAWRRIARRRHPRDAIRRTRSTTPRFLAMLIETRPPPVMAFVLRADDRASRGSREESACFLVKYSKARVHVCPRALRIELRIVPEDPLFAKRYPPIRGEVLRNSRPFGHAAVQCEEPTPLRRDLLNRFRERIA